MSYPIEVELSAGTFTLLDPEGEPSGPRVLLPSGAVTALSAHGGALDDLSEADLEALHAAVPSE